MKMRANRMLLWTLLPCLVAMSGWSENAANDDYEFFSGTVMEVTEDQITVERVLAGRPPERRVFSIVSDTIIEGVLRKNVRVTVGFVVSEENKDEAHRIIVRTDTKS